MCAEYRVPHSQFLAWPTSDRDKAIWWHVRKLQTCSECHTRPDEWDPAKGGRLDAYVASPSRCRGCAQVSELSERLDDPTAQIRLKPNTEVR